MHHMVGLASSVPISVWEWLYEFSACTVSEIFGSSGRSGTARDRCNDSLWPVARSCSGADEPTLSQGLLVGDGNPGYRMAWHSVGSGRARHVRVLLDRFTGLRSGDCCGHRYFSSGRHSYRGRKVCHNESCTRRRTPLLAGGGSGLPDSRFHFSTAVVARAIADVFRPASRNRGHACRGNRAAAGLCSPVGFPIGSPTCVGLERFWDPRSRQRRDDGHNNCPGTTNIEHFSPSLIPLGSCPCIRCAVVAHPARTVYPAVASPRDHTFRTGPRLKSSGGGGSVNFFVCSPAARRPTKERFKTRLCGSTVYPRCLCGSDLRRPPCRPTTHTKDKDLDRIEHPLYHMSYRLSQA